MWYREGFERKNNMRMVAFISVLAAGFVMAVGCGDSGITDPDDLVFPDSNVSYAEHVQPLFNLRCTNSGCHEEQTRAGDLVLTSYFNLTARPGIVVPFSSESSLLAQKIDGRNPHRINTPILVNANQIQGVKTWIDEGAKNN